MGDSQSGFAGPPPVAGLQHHTRHSEGRVATVAASRWLVVLNAENVALVFNNFSTPRHRQFKMSEGFSEVFFGV